MANDFPNCTFSGFDIIEPFSLVSDTISATHIPKNCQLIQHDVYDDFPYNNNTFDFVHQRAMQLVYSSDRVAGMFQQILRVTKDGGWIELVEFDIVPKRAGPIFSKINSSGKKKKKKLYSLYYNIDFILIHVIQ